MIQIKCIDNAEKKVRHYTKNSEFIRDIELTESNQSNIHIVSGGENAQSNSRVLKKKSWIFFI